MQVTHIGVYGIIIKSKKILLIKKSRGPYKDLLDLPGSKIEFGETISQALKREIKEETGVIVKEALLLENHINYVNFQSEGNLINLQHLMLLYGIEQFDDSKLLKTGVADDSEGCDWYQLEKLEEQDLSPTVNYFIKYVNDYAL